MEQISKVKSISIWIFIVPFIAVNICLILITQFHELFPNQGDVIHNTIPYFDGRVQHFLAQTDSVEPENVGPNFGSTKIGVWFGRTKGHLNFKTVYWGYRFPQKMKESNKRGGWNKHGGDAKFAKSLNMEVGINVEGGIL